MVTTTKIQFTGQSKCVTAQTTVESDSLPSDEVLSLAKKLMLQAQDEATVMTMRMQR